MTIRRPIGIFGAGPIAACTAARSSALSLTTCLNSDFYPRGRQIHVVDMNLIDPARAEVLGYRVARQSTRIG